MHNPSTIGKPVLPLHHFSKSFSSSRQVILSSPDQLIYIFKPQVAANQKTDNMQ
jgi:hypothetical protein